MTHGACRSWISLLVANAPEGVGWMLMPQFDIASITASSLPEMMSNCSRRHCCIERSCSTALMSMLCTFFTMVICGQADAGQTAVGQPDELELVMISITKECLKTMKHMWKQGCYIFALPLMLSTATNGQYNNNLSH